MAVEKPKRIEINARHPDSPTVKWQHFVADMQRIATESVERREARDASRERGRDYARAAEAKSTGG